MATLFVIFAIGLLVITAILQLRRRLRLSCWLLAIFPAIACIAALLDLSRGAAQPGQSTFESDEKQLAFCFVILLLNVAAALLPRWRILFWSAWLFNAAICAVGVYLAFFWHVFS